MLRNFCEGDRFNAQHTMKRVLFTATFAAAFFCSGAADFAWAEPEPPRPPGGERKKERFLEGLSPEVRERFKKARQKALEDPKIKQLRETAEAANQELFKAVRAKMLEIDPELAWIVNKRAKEARNASEGREGNRQDRQGYSGLDEADRQKLIAAREKARLDPAVETAEQAKRDAKSPEERASAAEAYRKAMRAAILKVDPSIEPLLDKIGRPSPGGPDGPAMQ